jgi:acyl carrier protein
LRALAGIGNNMNQIARRINTGEWDSLDVVKIVSALGAVERELAELRALHR